MSDEPRYRGFEFAIRNPEERYQQIQSARSNGQGTGTEDEGTRTSDNINMMDEVVEKYA